MDFQLIFSIAAIQYSEHFASVQEPGNVGVWPSNLQPPPTKINFHSDRLLTLPFFTLTQYFHIETEKAPLHQSGTTPFQNDLNIISDYSAMRISSIFIAEEGMRVPGPKMAATPAL